MRSNWSATSAGACPDATSSYTHRGGNTTFLGDTEEPSYRPLIDEKPKYRIVHKRRNYGHNAQHADDLAEFGKGTSDGEPGEYSRSGDRLGLTYDGDFDNDWALR